MYLASPAYTELASPFEQTEGWFLIPRLVHEVTLAAGALGPSTVPAERGAGEFAATKRSPELLVIIAVNDAAERSYQTQLVKSILRIDVIANYRVPPA